MRLCLQSGCLFTLQTLFCADSTCTGRRLTSISGENRCTSFTLAIRVTSRDGRKDCNNRDSLAHRMRGTIEAGGAEAWRLISVQECPLPFSIRSSGESQQAVFLGPCVGQIRFCSVTPQPRSSWFSAAGIWSGWNRGSLPLRAFPFHQR